MIKKLLFACILTVFSVVGTMAQTYDLFIGNTDTLEIEWFKDPEDFGDGFTSIGPTSDFGPYESGSHYQFEYDFIGWWCAGSWIFGGWDDGAQEYPLRVDLTGYTHLKLFWKGFSAGHPENTLAFSLSDSTGTGPNVTVCDNSSTGTYTQKLIPLSSFLGVRYDWDEDAGANVPSDTLHYLNRITKMNFYVAGDWGDTGGASEGVFFLDAMQFVTIEGTGVSKNAGTDSYSAYPVPFTDETVIKINSSVNAATNIQVMDTKGMVVSTMDGHFTNEEIAVGKGLEKGIYFVHVVYQDRAQVIKIVKM